ncbi:MAG: hypothetical protein IJ777_00840 [Clostridia bacterium]|nr:hypothetical protein [Clostridia bacterium]
MLLSYDLQQKILRKTTNAFKEDPLRVYRVVRFAASLGDFAVHPETILSIKELKGELPALSKERIFTEFKKALASEKTSRFFEVLKQAVVLDVHLRNNLQEQLDFIIFEKIGKECLLQINGNFIKQKYPQIDELKFGKMLHEERVKRIKNN